MLKTDKRVCQRIGISIFTVAVNDVAREQIEIICRRPRVHDGLLKVESVFFGFF
jgi:hypothetical protein